MLYGIKCWVVKRQHVTEMSVAEMRMLRWICVKTRNHIIRNASISGIIEFAPIEDKLRDIRLKWFGVWTYML